MSEDIFALVHADLDARNEKGLREYGKTLTAFDGRDTHRDLYEELLDAVMYERKRQVEREAALAAVDRIAGRIERSGSTRFDSESDALLATIRRALGGG